jgi:hypothetical protein
MPSLSLLGKPSKRISITNATLPQPVPDALVEKIRDAIDKALDNPEVQHQLAVADIPGKPMPLKDLATDKGRLRQAGHRHQGVGDRAAVGETVIAKSVATNNPAYDQ